MTKDPVLPAQQDPRVLSMIASLIIDQQECKVKGTEEQIHDDVLAIIRVLGDRANSKNVMHVLRHYYSNESDVRNVFVKMWGYEISQEPGRAWTVVADKDES